MRKLSDVLVDSLGSSSILKAARAQIVLKAWPDVVGGTLSLHCKPDRYDHGTIWVSSSGSAWAQELRLRQEALLQRLNELAGEPGLFASIRVGVRPSRLR